jgi:putative membrane protein
MMMGWILLLPLLVIGIIAAVLGWRPQGGGHSQVDTRSSPEEILNQRYARGEINREEHEQMREDLR